MAGARGERPPVLLIGYGPGPGVVVRSDAPSLVVALERAHAWVDQGLARVRVIDPLTASCEDVYRRRPW